MSAPTYQPQHLDRATWMSIGEPVADADEACRVARSHPGPARVVETDAYGGRRIVFEDFPVG